MALIQVTPDLLNSKANELRGLKAQHESMQPTFNNFSQMLEEYAKLLNTSAQKFQETDQSLQTSINGFGN